MGRVDPPTSRLPLTDPLPGGPHATGDPTDRRERPDASWRLGVRCLSDSAEAISRIGFEILPRFRQLEDLLELIGPCDDVRLSRAPAGRNVLDCLCDQHEPASSRGWLEDVLIH